MSFQMLLSRLVFSFSYPAIGMHVYIYQRYYWVAAFSSGTLGKGNATNQTIDICFVVLMFFLYWAVRSACVSYRKRSAMFHF